MFKWIQTVIRSKKEKKCNINNAIQYMVEYCEGRITSTDFFVQFNNNIYIEELIIFDKKAKSISESYFEQKIKSLDMKKIVDRIELYRVTANYFRRRNIKLNFFNPDKQLFDFISSICPNYCDFTYNEEFTKYFIEKYLDNNLDKKKGKAIIKELFIYEKYPPRWLQFCEWPIKCNKPCKFVYQTGFPNKHEYIEYHFRGEDNSEVVIVQYD